MIDGNSNDASSRSENLRRALFALEEIDGYGNLNHGLAISCFVISGSAGVYAFFRMVDLAAWLNVSEFMSLTLISAGWIVLFLVWVLAFLLIVMLCEALGIQDLRSVAGNSLSPLTLSHDELRELRGLLATRTWKHGSIFERVVDKLARERSRS